MSAARPGAAWRGPVVAALAIRREVRESSAAGAGPEEPRTGALQLVVESPSRPNKCPRDAVQFINCASRNMLRHGCLAASRPRGLGAAQEADSSASAFVKMKLKSLFLLTSGHFHQAVSPPSGTAPYRVAKKSSAACILFNACLH